MINHQAMALWTHELLLISLQVQSVHLNTFKCQVQEELVFFSLLSIIHRVFLVNKDGKKRTKNRKDLQELFSSVIQRGDSYLKSQKPSEIPPKYFCFSFQLDISPPPLKNECLVLLCLCFGFLQMTLTQGRHDRGN